jgi:SAM-dependent methyltransferase
MNGNLWTSTEHALDYLSRADSIPHRVEGETTLQEFIPATAKRILGLGTGDGRLLALIKLDHPSARAMALDFSPAMLAAARVRFARDRSVTVVAHNLEDPLPELDGFDAVVSSFAIHHLIHERKRALYAKIYACLAPAGVFCNLDHVASVTPELHEEFLHRIGYSLETEDPSNKLLDVETQLRWLREIGFRDLDCHWKGRELALLTGRRT